MRQFLKGKKTYLLALAAVVYALTGYLTGHLDAAKALQEVWAALTAAGLRAGIENALES